MFRFGWLFFFANDGAKKGFELMSKTQNPLRGTCTVCGAPAKTKFCRRVCRLAAKVAATRRQRPLKDHVCRCGQCGRSFHVGRPRRVIPEKLESENFGEGSQNL
jgi:hypothetical protein